MSFAYVFLSLTVLLVLYLCHVIFVVSKKQYLKKIHLEINKGIKFDSEFYHEGKKKSG